MYCRFCGKSIQDDSTFCSYCGKSISVSETDSKAEIHTEITDELVKSEDEVVSLTLKSHRKFWRKKWFWVISAVVLILVGIIAAVIIPKIKMVSKPITVQADAGVPIKTSFGLEYNIDKCGFQGNGLKVQMSVTNEMKMPLTITSSDWDDVVKVVNKNTKAMYSYDNNLTSNYRMYNATNSLFAESVEATLQPGATYEYIIIFTVSEKNASINDYTFSAPPFGPGENESHYSHFYLFNLKFIS